MYAQHQAKVMAYGRRNPDNFAQVLRFVIVTIRNAFYNVPADMGNVDRDEASFREIAWGWKARAINQIDEDKASLYAQAEEIYYHAECDREAFKNLLNLFTQVTGLGLAKAGFCCQLLYGVGGCLDTHNLERFGVDPSAIHSYKFKRAKTFKTRDRYLELYVTLVERAGSTQYMWDSWCEFMAERNPNSYRNAEHVSELHCTSLGI